MTSHNDEFIDVSNIRIQPFGFIKTENYLQELNLNGILNVGDIEAHNIYQFRIQVADQSYIIRKRVKDFQTLEHAVKHDMLLFLKHKAVTKESMDDHPKEKQKHLFNYLKQVVDQDSTENPNRDLLKFLDLSQVQYGDFRKLKEGFLKKKAGGRFSESRCTRCGTLWGRWSKRYFSVTNNGVMYCKGPFGSNARMRELLLFDYNFSMNYGKAQTGYKRGIKLQFATRHLLLVAPDYFTFTEFIKSISDAIKQCQYMQQHRFNSFAPVQFSSCKWYIDGENYFSDVMTALLSAKEYVYITDWWMSPDLYLRRPIATDETRDSTNQDSRLDRIFKKIADNGVVVHILMYMEPTLALKHDSQHTQNFLEKLSPNIIVLRHPSPLPQYWSHHEKIVIVDGKVGFLGGLDLCFGRMDTQEHLLYDLDVRKQFWPGIDYANNRMKDFENVKESGISQIERSDPRMPWHDIAIQVMGQSVADLVRHFLQYWNHVIINQKFQKRIVNQVIQKKQQVSNNYTKIQDADKNPRTQQNQNQVNTLFTQYKNQVKVEYSQEDYQLEVEESKETEEDDVFNRILFEKQRISTVFNKNKNCNKNFIEILEKITEQVETEQNEEIYEQRDNQMRQSQFIMPKVRYSLQKGNCLTQIIRSASNWSIGCSSKNTEFSIQLAYTQLISEAQNFIYIENQFFISSTDQNSYVENKIAEALVRRIQQAVLKKEKFKVIVFIPLLPGFAGEIDKESPILKVQLHWEYFTISRGGCSILERLRKDVNIPDPSEYIEFFSLRTHCKILEIPKTELIYIHSKLMIIDDEFALIGSANINDRSLKGDRDSEIAIVVHDQNKKQSYMNGQKIRASIFAQELRTSLYQEHFKLSYEQVIDPLSDELQQIIRQNTRRNTHIYREVFACYPDDNIKKISDYQQFKQKGNLEKYDQLKNQIVGNAVEFPLDFLCEENLKISYLQKEILLPDFNFT